MGCCIALAFVVAVIRRARSFVWPSRTPASSFAPPARRAAPGSAMPAAVTAEPLARAGWSLPVVMAAAGATWFLAGVIGMHVFGLFDFARHSLLADVAFHGSGLLLLSSGLAMLLGRRILSNDLQAVTR